MEFSTQKSELLRELDLVQGVVERKTTIPILSNLLLEATGSVLRISATDMELGVRCACPAKVKTDGAGTVPAKRLAPRSEEHTSELQSRGHLVCRLLLEKKN